MSSLHDTLCCYSLLVASLVLTSCGGGGAGGGGGSGPVAPSITTQPANQTVTVGQTATFTVVASGTSPLSYQWSKGSAAISGATSASYTTPATVASDNSSQFTVTVSNAAGSLTSSPTTLTVNVPPSITTQPASQTVTVGQTATFTVVATGTAPLTYQWQKNSVAISGATSASYTTPVTTAADNGAQFTVIASNAGGNQTSNAATLTVNVPPSITTQPANQTVVVGQTATFTVVASGTPAPSYQWQKDGANIAGATSASYTTPATAIADSGSQYTVVVSNIVGNQTSNAATLTVNNPTPQVSAISPTVVGTGYASSFTLTVTGQGFIPNSTIQENGTSRSTTFVSSTQLTTTIPASDVATSGQLAIIVVSPAPGGGMSNTISVIVNTSVAVNLSATTIINDPTPANQFGLVVQDLGDVTGTGKDAVGITAIEAAYIVFDPTNHPGSFTVSQVGSAVLPGTKFVYTGPGFTGQQNFEMSSCGDKDGDGINDICVQSNSATSDIVNKPAAGTTFVIRGGSWLTTHPVVDLNDSTPAVAANISRIEGAAKYNYAGQWLTNGGNFNGDGYAATIIGAPGYGPLTNGIPAGAVYDVPGGPDFFNQKLYDLANINSFGGILTRSNSTVDNGYSLGSEFPLSTIRLVGDFNGDGLPELIVGDPRSQNKTPNTQRVYVVFGNRNFRGTFFVEDIGRTFGGSTFFVDNTNACHLTDPAPCYGEFGAPVAGRGGSLMMASAEAGGVLNGQLTGGEVFVSTQPITNGQTIDVRLAVQNLQGTTLWDMNPPAVNPWTDEMGATLVDGADFRLIGMHGFDNYRGKLLFTSIALPGGNIDVATATLFTLTGENQGDELSYGLDRSQDGSILISGGLKFYYIPRTNLLF
jgi:Immunoglobulin domain/FG-GAP repeat